VVVTTEDLQKRMKKKADKVDKVLVENTVLLGSTEDFQAMKSKCKKVISEDKKE